MSKILADAFEYILHRDPDDKRCRDTALFSTRSLLCSVGPVLVSRRKHVLPEASTRSIIEHSHSMAFATKLAMRCNPDFLGAVARRCPRLEEVLWRFSGASSSSAAAAAANATSTTAGGGAAAANSATRDASSTSNDNEEDEDDAAPSSSTPSSSRSNPYSELLKFRGLKALELRQHTFNGSENLFSTIPGGVQRLVLSFCRFMEGFDGSHVSMLAAQCPSLQVLQLAFCSYHSRNFEIDETFISNLPQSLRWLSLSECALKTNVAGFAGLPRNLVRLDAGGNAFRLDFEVVCRNMPATLEHLDLSGSTLSGNMDTALLPRQLKVLNLAQCYVARAEFDCSQLPDTLVVLNLRRCNINSSINLARLPPHLEILDIGQNAFTGEVRARDLPHDLKVCLLDGTSLNGTWHWSDAPVELTQLNLEGTSVDCQLQIDAFPPTLELLDTSGHPSGRHTHAVDWSAIRPALKTLCASRTDLRVQLDLSQFPPSSQLEVLALDGNHLTSTSLDFRAIPRTMRILNLSNNQLANAGDSSGGGAAPLQLRDLPNSLRALNLEENQLSGDLNLEGCGGVGHLSKAPSATDEKNKNEKKIHTESNNTNNNADGNDGATAGGGAAGGGAASTTTNDNNDTNTNAAADAASSAAPDAGYLVGLKVLKLHGNQFGTVTGTDNLPPGLKQCMTAPQ